MEEFMCTLKTHKWCGRSKSKDTYLFSYVSFFWLNKIFTIKIIYIRIRKEEIHILLLVDTMGLYTEKSANC